MTQQSHWVTRKGPCTPPWGWQPYRRSPAMLAAPSIRGVCVNESLQSLFLDMFPDPSNAVSKLPVSEWLTSICWRWRQVFPKKQPKARDKFLFSYWYCKVLPPDACFINLHLCQKPRIIHLLEGKKRLMGRLWCQPAWVRTLPWSFKQWGALSYFMILSVSLFPFQGNSNHQNRNFTGFCTASTAQ